MVLAHKAGEKLFIDFAGKKLSYIEKDTGEVIYCQVFAACLPYSDYSFAMAVPSQSIETSCMPCGAVWKRSVVFPKYWYRIISRRLL
jgi:transposase